MLSRLGATARKAGGGADYGGGGGVVAGTVDGLAMLAQRQPK